MNFHIPENCQPVNLLAPAADAAGRTSTIYPSLKGAIRAFIVVHINQGHADVVALTPVQATAVAGTGSKGLTNNCEIWHNQDMGTAAATWTRATDAKTLSTSATLKVKCVVFQIDPARCMDINGGFDCIGLTTGASNAANITSAMLYIEPAYAQAQPVDALTD